MNLNDDHHTCIYGSVENKLICFRHLFYRTIIIIKVGQEIKTRVLASVSVHSLRRKTRIIIINLNATLLSIDCSTSKYIFFSL